MKKIIAAMFALALGCVAFGENLVREDMRDFEGPFKGEGKMGMQYVQVRFPSGTEGAVISAEVKIEGVKKGAQSWFDARIMTDFVDSEWKKLKGGPNIVEHDAVINDRALGGVYQTLLYPLAHKRRIGLAFVVDLFRGNVKPMSRIVSLRGYVIDHDVE